MAADRCLDLLGCDDGPFERGVAPAGDVDVVARCNLVFCTVATKI